MQMPDVPNVVRDQEKKITYTVMAYRQLSRDECVAAVRYFRSTKEGRKLKPNTNYTIYTTIR